MLVQYWMLLEWEIVVGGCGLDYLVIFYQEKLKLVQVGIVYFKQIQGGFIWNVELELEDVLDIFEIWIFVVQGLLIIGVEQVCGGYSDVWSYCQIMVVLYVDRVCFLVCLGECVQ